MKALQGLLLRVLVEKEHSGCIFVCCFCLVRVYVRLGSYKMYANKP